MKRRQAYKIARAMIRRERSPLCWSTQQRRQAFRIVRRDFRLGRPAAYQVAILSAASLPDLMAEWAQMAATAFAELGDAMEALLPTIGEFADQVRRIGLLLEEE